MALLELSALRKAFGGLVATDDVSVSIAPNAIHGLIGPNGAGKTTLFSLITGFYRANSGTVRFDRTDVSGLTTSARARRGLVTLQSNLLFGDQTVLENVVSGALISRPRHAFDWLYERKADREAGTAAARDILDFCRLTDKADVSARGLSHGQQRVLGIAVALAARPRLLLLDEPFTGMTAREKDDLATMIQSIRARGTTIILVEHDMRAVMRLCDRITVLNFGRVLAEGTPEQVRRHPDVMAAYLGRREMLELRNLDVHYGAVSAIRSLSLMLPAGTIGSIIGSNGAGKSTTLRAISGLVRPSGGEIWFDGARIDRLDAKSIVARGIAHVPEGRRVFPELTVEENLRIGGYLRGDRVALNRDFDEICSEFPRLAQRRNQLARTLSGGEQQMLAIGRAVMSNPRLILMDEPSMGLSPIMVAAMTQIIQRINKSGRTVLLVEQNASVALSICDQAVVLEQGRLVLSGTGAELKDNEHVRIAYIGI